MYFLKVMGFAGLIYQTSLMVRQRRAIIIGGGVIGVTTAYALARDGWQVQILERHQDVAREASYGNGRQLSYSHTNALASPHIIKQIPYLMTGADEAFRMTIGGGLGYYSWIAQFLLNCTPSAFNRNTAQITELAQESRIALERLLECHEIEFQHRKCGKLVLLRSEAEVDVARQNLSGDKLSKSGAALISASKAKAIEPALDSLPDEFAGALYAMNDATGDCSAFSRALLHVLQTHYGAQFWGGQEVIKLRVKSGRPQVVMGSGDILQGELITVTSGLGAKSLLAGNGYNVPLQPMKGYSFTAPIGECAPVASITDSKRRIVFTNLGDRMLVAGIAEMGRVNSGVEPVRLQSMIDAARSSMPSAALYDEADAGWAGMRPMTPNSQPITKMLAPGLAINAGHGMLGWTLAMGSAERLSKAVSQAG